MPLLSPSGYALDRGEFDALPFGTIKLESEDRVVIYNAFEGQSARRDSTEVLGQLFFETVAPCTNNTISRGELQRMIDSGRKNARFDYEFRFPWGARAVRIRTPSEEPRQQRSALLCTPEQALATRIRGGWRTTSRTPVLQQLASSVSTTMKSPFEGDTCHPPIRATIARVLALCPMVGAIACGSAGDPSVDGTVATGNTAVDSGAAGTTTTPTTNAASEAGSDAPPATAESTASGATTAAEGTESGGSSDCIGEGDAFAVDRLRERVEYLASEELAGRVPGTPGDLAAREMIAERFGCLGLLPGGDDGGYQQAFVNADGTATANVVGFIPGSDPEVGHEIVVVGAHHDHFGLVDGQLLLGANDNASGVVAVLAVAETIAAAASPPLRTVAFVTFGSEETAADAPYVEGSAYYVDHPPRALPIADTVYVVNLDMVGSYADTGTVYAIGTYPDTPAAALFESVLPTVDLDVGLYEPPEIGSSDHYPFCLAGVPFVFMWTDDPDCYHQACDVPDQLDYPALSTITNMVAEVVAGLADHASLAGAAPGSCGE